MGDTHDAQAGPHGLDDWLGKTGGSTGEHDCSKPRQAIQERWQGFQTAVDLRLARRTAGLARALQHAPKDAEDPATPSRSRANFWMA